MPICKECENEVDALVAIKVDGKAKKLCEDCADRVRETAAIAEESESVVQNMMGFKGREIDRPAHGAEDRYVALRLRM